MANLSGLVNLDFEKIVSGAYKEPVFFVVGIAEPVLLSEILEWLDDTKGGGGGGGITVGGEFDDDVAAAAGGIAIGDYYTLSAATGLQGVVKKRIA